MSFEAGRLLGAAGSLLAATSFPLMLLSIGLPPLLPLSLLLLLAALVAIAASMYLLSRAYGEEGIARDFLLAAAAPLLALPLALVFFALSLLSLLLLSPLLALLFAGLALLSLPMLLLISGYLFFRSLSSFGRRSGESLFQAAGALLLLSSISLLLVLTAPLFPLLALSSFILLAAGFYGLRPPSAQATLPSTGTS